MAIIVLVMLLAVLVVTVLSCVSDVRLMRIPNVHSFIILACFIPAWLAGPTVFSPLWYHIAAMGIMFVVTYTMFCMGMMGGGDSKLGTVLGLWVGLKGLLPFIFYMAIMGGILGLMTIFLQRKKPFINPRLGSWVALVQAGQNAVPYGIAISFGSWASFFHTGLIHHQLNEVFKIIH